MRISAGQAARGLAVAAAIAACGETAAALPAGASGARSFRPVSGLFFLPDRAPAPAADGAVVPDSKIAWDLRVIANGLGLGSVRVDVEDQVVRLSGRAPTLESREAYLRIAKRTVGVRRVEGDLEVGP